MGSQSRPKSQQLLEGGGTSSSSRFGVAARAVPPNFRTNEDLKTDEGKDTSSSRHLLYTNMQAHTEKRQGVQFSKQ